MEKLTSRNMVAVAPRYSPKIPRFLNNSMAILVAEIGAFPSLPLAAKKL